MHIDLRNKRVLVTGGNSGLGAAMARAFSASGARVAINYVAHADATDALLAELKEAGAEAIGLHADVSDAGAVEAMFAGLDQAWGGIDVLVSNAGIDGVRANGWEAEVDAWSKVIDVNLKGAYLCARQALRRMVPQGSGVVLNTTSVHEEIPWAGYSAYAASKAGLSMMAKSLALEAAPFGVRVLCLAPGAVRTPINRAVWDNPEQYRDLLTKIPLGRMGEAEEIGGMAVMLASDTAAYLTGTTVFVDGGMTTYPAFAHGG
jgi:NAD(P)-dependent dehydrogenase (short-subunit alcohol dehydrogenase family)